MIRDVGIEGMNVFVGTAFLNSETLARHRHLDMTRFNNLLMKEKTVALTDEDPVTFAVNAAMPLIEKLDTDEKNRIEMLITCTESALDFGKSISTYCHHYLELSRNCRLFELKSACHSGAIGLQMAINFCLAQVSPGAKVLIIASDITRFMTESGSDVLTEDWSFAEPSGGAGAVACLVSETPHVFAIDVGANGYYSYEVMDTCRPAPDKEAGNADLSLFSYMDCSEQAFLDYQKKVENVDYVCDFDYLVFHTPFAGMVKGTHRRLMRKMAGANLNTIEQDFVRRVYPGLKYCQRVGNMMGATTLFSLASAIDNGTYDTPKKIGCFSYGSGCSSEFFSGKVSAQGKDKLRLNNIAAQLNARCELSMDEYEELLLLNQCVKFGTRNVILSPSIVQQARRSTGRNRLYLKEIKDYHRKYEWTA